MIGGERLMSMVEAVKESREILELRGFYRGYLKREDAICKEWRGDPTASKRFPLGYDERDAKV